MRPCAAFSGYDPDVRIMRYFKLMAVFLVLLAVLPVRAAAQEKDLDDNIRNKETELQKLRREIAEQRDKIKDLEKKEKNVSGLLEKLEKEESLVRKLMKGLEEKSSMLQEQADDIRVSLEQNEKEYARRLDILSARLREMYKEGPKQDWQRLLAAKDFTDLMQRYKFLALIAERDADMVSDVREKKAEVERQEAEITELLHEVMMAKNEKAKELEKLKENEKKRRGSLSSLQSDMKRYRLRADELAQAERKLQDFIADLEKARLEKAKSWGEYGERNFPGLKGKLPRPAEGSTARKFGKFRHPEFGTVTYNTGIDIETRCGEPVRAVARGRVEYSGELAGYGNCIIINHGDGFYTLYAHASEIFVVQGEQVEKGGLLAETGTDPSTSAGSLHFEIRKSKTALDPDEWLEGGGKK